MLFDLDDTLMDHQTAAARAVAVWAAEHGLHDDPRELAERWVAVSNRWYHRWQLREVTVGEQQQARVREFLPHLDLTDDDAAQGVFDAYGACYRAASIAFTDARPALERALAAGLAVGVLTNGDAAVQHAKLERGGLDDLVDAFVPSSDLPWSKPDPRAFRHACDLLGSEPASTLMVGDSLTNDVHGARSAGLPAVLLDRHGAAEDADLRGAVRVRSLDDLAFTR